MKGSQLTNLKLEIGKLLLLVNKNCDIGWEIFKLEQKIKKLHKTRKHIKNKVIRQVSRVEKEWDGIFPKATEADTHYQR